MDIKILDDIYDALSGVTPCNGRCVDGKIPTPEWVKYQRAKKVVDDTEIRIHDLPAIKKWKVQERSAKLSRLEKPADYVPVEPTEKLMTCNICNGSGNVRLIVSTVDLQRLLRRVVRFLKDGGKDE